jgi:hypothetical protein
MSGIGILPRPWRPIGKEVPLNWRADWSICSHHFTRPYAAELAGDCAKGDHLRHANEPASKALTRLRKGAL